MWNVSERDRNVVEQRGLKRKREGERRVRTGREKGKSLEEQRDWR